MFSDESRFSFQSDSRQTLIWRAPGTSKRTPLNNTVTVVQDGSRVWGGIIIGSRNDLHIQSVTMTGHIYRDVILEQHVRLFRGAMGAEFLFMDDNTRPHRANIVDECLQSEDITRMDWPAYSPDLNPIEHVWDMLGRRIAARQPPPTCLPELRRILFDEWCNIPQDQIDNLILSMPRRCLYARRPVVCVPLKRRQRRARLSWAKEHVSWTGQRWTSVLFTDESRFTLESDSGSLLIWRERNTRCHQFNTHRERHSYRGGGIMVWTGISLGGDTDLHVFQGGTLTGVRYRDDILDPYCTRILVQLAMT
ncbi:transposable element Tc3 transposase [Trichonephila clavipes]|uniref:Transposable element Tc3 transposase n=1 Tax=Trichonephila clavipes TaxID=2585209 RepID=A0A8X6US28_TRICX|nr:transposable element Tc3 transposase [Trichonephila clavipes]